MSHKYRLYPTPGQEFVLVRHCAVCGHTDGGNRESQAVFSCQSCGYQANTDVNAAQNINAAGLAVSGRGGTPHQGPDETSTPDAA